MKHIPWLKGIGAMMLGLTLQAAGHHAQAQAWPAKPVRIIVTFGPGTGVEVVGRLTGQAISKNTGQPFVIEPRTGAGGTIAHSYVLSTPADGYTLLVDSSSHTSVPALMANLPFDTLRDFSGVTTLIENPITLVTAASTGFRTVADLVAAAKAKPGSLSFASAGVGTSTHISAEKFRLAAGFNAVHIPFKSTTEAITELLGGRMHYTNTALTTALPGVRDNRLVALAMSSRRSNVLPNVPTIAEAGYPEGLYASWVGMVIAAKTPRDIVNRVHQEVIKALATAEVKDQLAKIAADIWTMTPEEFDVMRRREVAETQKLVKAIGIKVQ